MDNIGQKFFKDTSYLADGAEPGEINEPDVKLPEFTHESINLDKPKLESELAKLINKRRSKRNFSDTPMTQNQLSEILWLTQGITAEIGVAKLRAVASAGNRHPFNNYVLVNNVAGLKKGLYLYESVANQLIPLKLGDLAEEFKTACLGQKMISNCQICYIQTAVTARTTARYRARGYRYIFLDAGHIGAQAQLVCENLGLGSCNVGAYLDDSVAKFLDIKSEFEIPVYITVIGEPVS